MTARTVDEEEVRRALLRLFLPPPPVRDGDGDGADLRVPGLRREDLKKAVEVAALLNELGRIPPRGVLVDAAAGHAYVGLLAVELLGWQRAVLIERNPARITRCQEAIARLTSIGLAPPLAASIHLRAGDVGDRALWPDEVDVVVALHACGAASDLVLDAAVAAEARWLFLVPCCYARSVRFSPHAEARADALGVPAQPEVRRRFVEALIAAERTLRLESAGYEVTVAAFVPPTVTPHNLVWRARRVGEPRKMAASRARLDALWQSPAA